MSLPQEKTEEIQTLGESLLARPSTTTRSLLTFLGKVTFASCTVLLTRLHTRELQTALMSVYKHPGDMSKQVPPHSEARVNLEFWQCLQQMPHPLRCPVADVIMATDASDRGWGASLHSLCQQTVVDGGETSPHQLSGDAGSTVDISALCEEQICVHTNRQPDNSNVKEGGTRSPRLSRLACCILLWCQRQRIKLMLVYMQGMGNMVADALSCRNVTEWFLCPRTVQRIFSLFRTPDRPVHLQLDGPTEQVYMSQDSLDCHVYAVVALVQPGHSHSSTCSHLQLWF